MKKELKISQVKALRDKTGLSIGQCRQALSEAGGDEERALEILKGKAALVASKKASRTLCAGVISAYVHSNKKIGAMVNLACETDFVARNQEFLDLAHSLAMHIAAMAPADKEELESQPFVKDPNLTISQLIEANIQKFGERIEIVGFSRQSSA